MNQRLLNGIALCLVGLVVIGGVVVMAIDQLQPPPVVVEHHKRKHPPQPISAAEQKLLAEAEANEKDQAPIDSAGAQASPIARQLTWPEVEQELAKLRAARANSPTAWSELEMWYERLGDIQFTESKDYPEHIKKLEEWQAAAPMSPTPRVALGRAYIRYAWDARGSGLAGTVSEVGWELFHQRIEEAKRLLEEAVQLGPQDGEAHARLIEVAKALGSSREETDAIVEAGRKLDATYFPLYQEMAVNLLPRWGGAPGDIEKFAAGLATAIPGDDGLLAFALVAHRIHFYENLLFRGEYDSVLLGKAAVALAESYRDSAGIVQFAALMTLAAQDHSAAKRIRTLVGPFNPEHRVWPNRNAHELFEKWSETNELPAGEIARIPSLNSRCRGLAFAPNERYLWTANELSQAPVRLFEWQTGDARDRLLGPAAVLLDVSFNLRHKWVAAGFGRGQYQGWMLWDTQSQELVATRATDQWPRAIAIHPKSPQIAWLEAGALRILDVPSDEVRVDVALPLVAERLSFSPNGTWLAASKGAAIVVCDPESGNVGAHLDPRDQQPSAQPAPNFVGIDDEGRLLLLRRMNRRPPLKSSLVRRSADGMTDEVLIPDLGNAGFAFLSSDQRLLAVACDIEFQDGWQPMTIEVWDIGSAQKRNHLAGHWNQIEQLAFSADGKYLASSAMYTDVIKVWRLDQPGSGVVAP